MAYQQLAQPTPETWLQRLANIESLLIAKDAVGVLGPHFYAGGFVPSSLSAGGTDTAGVSTVVWVCEMRIQGNQLLTGISYLIGSVGGTDKVIVALYDSAGNLLANSALAGATVGTASTFQRVAFTAQYQAAPGKYYVAVSTNGTTAKIQTQAAGDHDAGSITGQVFATLPNPMTVPTTFTAAKAPVAMLY